jgi:hypothetical protein
MYLGAIHKPSRDELILKLDRGKLIDSSGLGQVISNNGAILAADHNERANKGWALITSSKDKISTAIDFTANQNFSIALGYKVIQNGTNRTIIGADTDYFAIRVSSGVLNVLCGTTNVTTDVAIAENVWYFLLSVFTTNNIKIYLNGIEEVNITINSIDLTNIMFGNQSYRTRTLYGVIDNIYSYNRALSVHESQFLFNFWRSH